MSKKHCSNCYYGDKCDCSEVCKDYTPVDELIIDEEVDEIIEANRTRFRAEWFKYIENYES